MELYVAGINTIDLYLGLHVKFPYFCPLLMHMDFLDRFL